MKLDDRTAQTIRAYLHPDRVARFGGAIRVPGIDNREPTGIRTLELPIRQRQAPAPFTGTHYLVYRWYFVAHPITPDVPLISGESYLVDCGDTWLVTGTTPL